MPQQKHNFVILTRLFRISVVVATLLMLAACAGKTPPVFFPAEPASPRLQLLTSFNNQGSLRDNKAIEFLVGEDYTNEFSKAYGLAFHNGRLFVADSGKKNPGIAVVDFTTKTLLRFNNGVIKPVTLDIDTDGTVYVCDLSTDQKPGIVVLDNQLRFLRRMTLDIDGYRPVSALVVGDKLYVADLRYNLIRVLDKNNGELLQNLAAEANLGWPVDLSLNPDGNLVVTETGAQRLRVLTLDGKVLAQIGSPGDRSGNFSRPKATAIDRDGNIYAVDVAFQNVQILDPKGRPLMFFGRTHDKNSLYMPAGIAITYDNLEVFQPYAAPGFLLEYVIAVSSQGGPPNFGSKVTIYGFGKMAGKDYSVK